MKSKFFLLVMIFIFFFLSIAIAQEEWSRQKSLVLSNTLNDLFVFDENSMIAVGDSGTVTRTSDGGESWDIQYSVCGIESELDYVHFIDDLNGWATAGGCIIQTSDGGKTWVKYPELGFEWIRDVYFRDKNNWWATYALWVFQLFNHKHVKVMDGGRLKWEQENRPLTREVPQYVKTEVIEFT